MIETTEKLIKAALAFWPILKELRLDQLEPNTPLWRELAGYDFELPPLMKDRARSLMAAIEDYKVATQ